MRSTSGMAMLGAIAVMAVAGCTPDDAAEPASDEHVYRLARVGTSTPPVVLEQDSAGCSILLEDATISLVNGAFDMEYSIHRVCGVRQTALPDPGRSGTFRRVGDSVRFVLPGGESMEAAHVRGDTITLSGPVHHLIFVREPR